MFDVSVNYSRWHFDEPAIEVTFDDLVSLFAPSRHADMSDYIVTYLLGTVAALDEMGALRHPTGKLTAGQSVVVQADATFSVKPPNRREERERERGMDVTPDQEDLRRKGLEQIAKMEAWMAAHPDEVQAIWERLDRDEAAFAACEHDWQADERDTRWKHCARCGWGAFEPPEPDADRPE